MMKTIVDKIYQYQKKLNQIILRKTGISNIEVTKEAIEQYDGEIIKNIKRNFIPQHYLGMPNNIPCLIYEECENCLYKPCISFRLFPEKSEELYKLGVSLREELDK